MQHVAIIRNGNFMPRNTVRGEIDLLISTFDSLNDQLATTTQSILAGIIRDRALHARFLNTLSMLEHMGSHKIMATQHGPTIDQPTLKHLAEETRHAFFFKRLAEREAGRPLHANTADLLAPLAARRYFGRLEAQVMACLPKNAGQRTPYLIMSMIVEFRAVWAYRIYQGALAQAGHDISLKSLLAEEAGHLTDMAARLNDMGHFNPTDVHTLSQAETRLYEGFLLKLMAAAQDHAFTSNDRSSSS